MTHQYTIRTATEEDLPKLLPLLPELTDFDVPERRNPDDLWTGDAALMKQALTEELKETFVDLAEANTGEILGLVMITMREELMSHAPSAHLETIIVAPSARGTGLGRALLHHTEKTVKARGAESLSLHVFRNNRRAHALYEAEGFDSELIRAIKWFDA